MSVPLPESLDPWRAVRSGSVFGGQVALSGLVRLASVILTEAGDEARVLYELRFGRDDSGRPVVLGRLRSRLRLTCQRCLGEMLLEVDAPLGLALVSTEQGARDLPEDLDPCLVEDDVLRPLDLIEDELLMAIPTFPRHEPGCCAMPGEMETINSMGPGVRGSGRQVAPNADPGDRINPFASLADLIQETGHGWNRGD